MKKNRCTFIIGLLFLPFLSFSQFNYQWAFTAGGTYTDIINDMAIDQDGNIYVIGSYASILDFDPGDDSLITEQPGTIKIFFAKYTKNKELVFAKTLGTDDETDFQSGISIALDDEKNIFISGRIGNEADMDTGPGTALIQTTNGTGAFVAKYDSVGMYVSSFSISTEVIPASLTIDDNNNLNVFGFFTADYDFDPGPGISILDGGFSKTFLARYTNDFDLLYAIAFDTIPAGFEYNEMYISDAQSDNDGSTYITGYFQGGFDLDPGVGVSPIITSSESLFIAKYDHLGNLIFAKNLETSETSYFGKPQITLDNSGNFYISDGYAGTVDFDPNDGTELRTALFGTDIFFVKYDSLGNLLFVKTIAGSGEYDYATNIKLGENNNIYITGNFTGMNDLDPGPGEALVIAPSTFSDMFLAKYDNAGNYITSISMGGDDLETPYCFALDQEGNVYIAGDFQEIIDPDPYGVDLFIGGGFNDLFIAKYGQNLTPTTDLIHDKSNITVTPNPGTGLFRISFQNSEVINSIRIVDMNGNEVNAKQQFSDTVVVDLEQLPSGVYLGIVSNASGVQTVKIVKI